LNKGIELLFLLKNLKVYCLVEKEDTDSSDYDVYVMIVKERESTVIDLSSGTHAYRLISTLLMTFNCFR
jgi:hypothetical protein